MIAVVTGRGSESARTVDCKLTSRVSGSARPVERRGKGALPRVLELHAERLDLGRGWASDSQSGVGRMEHAAQLGGLTSLLRSKILDFDSDVVPDLDAVPVSLVRVFDRQGAR